MTPNKFAYLVYRLFQERGIDHVEFESSTYENDSLRPYCPVNEAYILSVYIESGEVGYSTERSDGMLTKNTILGLDMDACKFLEGLFIDLYDYISCEETDGTCEEFIEESMKEISIFKTLHKATIPGDYHFYDNEIVIYIEDGDWKHDHAFTQWKMYNMGFVHLFEDVEPSDSDSYTSTHHYLIP